MAMARRHRLRPASRQCHNGVTPRQAPTRPLLLHPQDRPARHHEDALVAQRVLQRSQVHVARDPRVRLDARQLLRVLDQFACEDLTQRQHLESVRLHCAAVACADVAAHRVQALVDSLSGSGLGTQHRARQNWYRAAFSTLSSGVLNLSMAAAAPP